MRRRAVHLSKISSGRIEIVPNGLSILRAAAGRSIGVPAAGIVAVRTRVAGVGDGRLSLKHFRCKSLYLPRRNKCLGSDVCPELCGFLLRIAVTRKHETRRLAEVRISFPTQPDSERHQQTSLCGWYRPFSFRMLPEPQPLETREDRIPALCGCSRKFLIDSAELSSCSTQLPRSLRLQHTPWNAATMPSIEAKVTPL